MILGKLMYNYKPIIMKLFKLLPLCALLFLGSCEDENKENDNIEEMAQQTEARDPAAANAQWIDAWNRNNPQELDTLTSEDAVLYLQGQPMKTDSIRAWYKNAAPMMKDLSTKAEMNYANKEIAYEAGTYRHGTKNDSLNNIYEGAYTLLWKRTDKDWKLQVMHISESEPDTTTNAAE